MAEHPGEKNTIKKDLTCSLTLLIEVIRRQGLILSGVVGATRRFTGPRTVRAVSLISALMFAAFAVGIFVDGARRLLLPLLG